ncbi:flagellar export protein FliJ [Halopseudomonas phragmitis]|uniref:Flagellar FliJ protein n=2 Tax=Pseudomonadaceae TaxID=135621 RepID=A0A1V0B4Z2_9GAMM|nr:MULTISPECIES: flagellar export protein FliJ [Pseudomonadaceae]AQZ95006.1 flagellar protein FliJ [Halopseudomonas phragmitis]RHW23165.1 flagella biosynthesis chaperone FliJ [Pseudomonas jilinensis]
MSETRIRRLIPVLDMALEDERKAAAMLGQCQRQVDDAEARLRDLEYYSGEYQKGWSQRGAQGVGRDWLLNYQRFMGQMQSAIEQQGQTVAWHRQSLDKARAQWQQRYQRLEALRKLIERYRQEARARADRQEQKLLDELSQRARGNY